MMVSVDSVRDSSLIVSTTSVPKNVPPSATMAQGSKPSPNGRAIMMTPENPTTAMVMRRQLTSSCRTRSATPTMRIGRENKSEDHTSEVQSLMRNSYAVFCLKKKIDKRMYRRIHDEQHDNSH